MNYYGYAFNREDELSHHGILGQKWGVRRYQNPDGTLTEAGKKRYGEYGMENRPSHKEISKEQFDLQNKYTNKGISADKEMTQLLKITDGFQKKYGLDKFESADAADDAYWQLEQKALKDEKLRKEMDEYESASSAYAKRYNEYRKQGQKQADDEILKKYGILAKSDTGKSDAIKTGAIVAASIIASPIIVPAAIIIAAVGSHSKPKKNKES